MATELAKAYDPKEAQTKCLAFWTEKNFGHSEPDGRPPYTIVIPPPNVTGALHMGHALNNTLQDVLIRWRRMQGYNAEWLPGTDHAGIATQSVVEKRLFAEEKKTRREIGREALVKRIWAWKDQYEARILGQLRQMGCSCDWPRTRFTLDDGCSQAVREIFFNMFRDGYIFRGKRLVNWDTHLQTSVSDDETYTDDITGDFFTFKYPVKGQPDTFIRFSTTRPETMLGDTAVCVHPNDERYKALIGQFVTIPLNGREIPIIADGQLADPELGTGCVKVTPAHDPNDYACFQRNPHIGIINILNPDGTINEHGGSYQGQKNTEARKNIVAAMDALGLFEGKEDRKIPMKYSDRSKTPIEPYLSDQWFVKMGDRTDGKPGLAQMAMDAVTSGRVTFFPDRYAKTYLEWLGEKRDWCISRQLWWGHRIPVWHTNAPKAELERVFAQRADVCFLPKEDGTYQVCTKQDQPDPFAGQYTWHQDEDVLDTWFSSQLWTHSTFGWPEQTPDLKYYYPTSTLVTSRDIITLWVARMVIAGLYNMGEVPFRHVYITPKMLDGFGEGMSKTKGNGVDPLDIIEIYGADALRYQMVAVAGETQDSRLPVSNMCPHCGELNAVKQEHMYMRTKKVNCTKCKKPFRPGGPWPDEDPELPTARQASERFEIGRNFANKLWNATRFILLNLDGYTPAPLNPASLPLEDRWIISRLTTTVQTVTEQLEGYRFNEVSRTIYDFTWSEFCDWYIEMAKGRLKDDAGKATVQRVLVNVLDSIIRMVHPIMPFVAETLWQALNEAAPQRGFPTPTRGTESVMRATWPELPTTWQDPAMETRLARMQELVRVVRDARNRYEVDGRTPLHTYVRCSANVAADLAALRPFIVQLAGVGVLEYGPETKKPKQAASQVTPEFEAYISLEGIIDPTAEVKRLEKQVAEKRKQLEGTKAKLANESFVSRAPAEVVAQQRELVQDLEKQLASLDETIRELQS